MRAQGLHVDAHLGEEPIGEVESGLTELVPGEIPHEIKAVAGVSSIQLQAGLFEVCVDAHGFIPG